MLRLRQIDLLFHIIVIECPFSCIPCIPCIPMYTLYTHVYPVYPCIPMYTLFGVSVTWKNNPPLLPSLPPPPPTQANAWLPSHCTITILFLLRDKSNCFSKLNWLFVCCYRWMWTCAILMNGCDVLDEEGRKALDACVKVKIYGRPQTRLYDYNSTIERWRNASQESTLMGTSHCIEEFLNRRHLT